MTVPLPMVITDAGRAALVAAAGTNAVILAQAGFTANSFLNSPTLTALPGEFKRVDTVSGTGIDDATIHLTIRDDDAEDYTVRAIGIYLDDGTLFAVYAQPNPIVGKVAASTFYVALDIKVIAGDVELIEFGNANFLNPPASEGTKGVAYLATLAEALAGAVADKLITPATMKAVLDSYVHAERLGAPNGVATLGADGKLLVSQRPPIDLIDVFGVASEAAQLALAATPGDFAVRADTGLVYVLQQAPATVMGNWLEISTPAPVSSVNGKVGTIVLTAADVGAVPVTRTIAAGGLLTGGGALDADRTISLAVASAAEALAGALESKALTPKSLSQILAILAAKAESGNTVTGAGVLAGQGGPISTNPVLNLVAASASEITAGTAGDRVVTPHGMASLPKSLTPNGYAVLPGGLIIQWVQFRQMITAELPFTISFPIAFPNVVLPIQLTAFITYNSNVRDMWMQIVGPPTLSSAMVQSQSDDGMENRLDGFDMIVIGA